MARKPISAPSHFGSAATSSKVCELAGVAIVLSATLVLIWVWQRPINPISVKQVLERAEASDRTVSHEKAGVVYHAGGYGNC